MTIPNIKGKKKNNNLTNGNKIRLLKDSAFTKPLSAKRVGKRVEEEIKTLKQQMEFILGVTKTGLDIIDSEFNIRYIDPEWAKVYGDPTGRKCYEYFMSGKAPCPGCGIPKALKTKKPTVTEEILAKENSRPIQVTTIPFQNSDREWLVAEVNVDISERKCAEESLQKAHEELERRVHERTAELARASEAMQAEITERKRTEETLRRSEETAKRMAQENAIMAGIGRIISSSLNIEDVYEQFAGEVHKLIPFDGIAINIINHKEGTVTVPYVAGINVPGCHPRDTFSLEGSVTGEVANKRSGLIIQMSDRNKLPGRFHTLLTAFDTGLRSVMAVPLISKDRVIGAIHFRSIKAKVYSDQDLKLAESIASQIGGAIANTQLFTEHKQAEEALRESEERYRTVLENIEDGYYEVDLPGNFTFFNDPVCQLFGYSKDELMGMNDRQVTDHANAKKLYQTFNEVYKTGKPTKGFGWEIIRKDGTKRYIEASISLIKDPSGQAIGFRGIVRDVTERKRAEEMLRDSERKYRDLVDNAPIGIYKTDLNGSILFANQALSKMFEFNSPEEMISDGLLSRYKNPEDREILIGSLKEEGKVANHEIELLTKSGKSLNVLLSATFDGDILSGMIKDITERKRAEEGLRESEERYRTILDNIEDGYYEVDLPGNFTFFNDSLCRMLGYSKDELIGMGNQQYTDPENRKKLFQAFNEVYRTGEPTNEFDWEVIRKDGTKVYGEVSVSLIKDSNGHPTGFRGIARDITERKRAEEETRHTLSLLNATLESTADGILVVDRGGKIVSFNQKFVQMWHIPKSIMASQDDDRALAFVLDQLKDPEGFLAKVKELYSQPEAESFDLLEFKDGRVFERYSQSQRIGEQSVGRVWGFRDVTERWRAEEALKASEEKYRLLVENAGEAIFVAQDGMLKFANRNTTEMFGFSKDELTSKPFQEFIHPDDRGLVLNRHLKRLEGHGLPSVYPFRIVNKSGNFKWVELKAVLITWEGKPATLNFLSDITERKEGEEALQESEKKFRVLTETAASGIFIHQGEKFVYVNPASEAMTGYSREELLTMDFWHLVHPDFRELVKQRAQARQQGKSVPSRYELKIITKNGEERWVDLAVGMIDFQGKPAILGTDFDITERKRAEEEMRALEEQLRQSQKIEAIGRLAGGIAHDFNNLLTVIKGYSQLSLLDLKESDPLWGNIQEIQKATQRATDLTRHLLAFSRRQILDLKVLDLNSLLRDLDKMLRRIIGEDIELNTLLVNNLGRVKIDPGQIEQVILNLAVNARDAMPSGGKLIIETANVELDEQYAHTHMGVIPSHYVRLSVSDTGLGMSRGVKEKIFEPFFTTKEKGKGTGLGLSTVYGIVKQSGGNIWVYSEPGHGTTFKIYLPRVEEELDALSSRDETDSLPRGNETILLVEDEPLVRDLAHRFLTEHGYTILEAADGEEALRAAQEHAGKRIHLLLTDVVMPQMGGKELADRLRRLRPSIKVLYTSGYTDEAIVHHGVLDPGTHFLQKPFSPKTLLHKVREVLDR